MPRSSLLQRFTRDASGIAMIEFAIAVPVLLFAFFALVEITRFVQYKEKLESSATQILDIIDQNQNVTAAGLDNLFEALVPMLSPFDASETRIVVSHVVRPPLTSGPHCKPVITWQYGAVGQSRIGRRGQPADTRSITVQPGDHVMVIEVVGIYTSMFDNEMVGVLMQNLTGEIYRRNYARPRYGAFRIDPNTGRNAAVPCV